MSYTHVGYSPLCDTDSKVYADYLRTLICINHGSRVIGGCDLHPEGRECICASVGGWTLETVVGKKVLAVCGQGNADGDGSVDGVCEGGVLHVTRNEVDAEGGSGGGERAVVVEAVAVGSGGSDEVASQGGRAVQVGVVDAVLGDGGSSSGVVVDELKMGNRERNRKNRAAQKARKKARKISGTDWRKRDPVVSKVSSVSREVVVGVSDDTVAKRGFFSSCSAEVQRDLRESRARMLIAENERRAREEKKKVELMDSPEALMKEVIRVSTMALRLKKQTENQAIGGWAATVADSLVKSVAESAPSSVPSLEEVGYGKSSLKSSDGFDPEADLKRQLRREEYRSELSNLKEWYASQDAYDVREEERCFKDLDEQYADVLLTAEEFEKKKIFDDHKMVAQAVCTNLAGQGVNLERLRDAMIDLKFMTEEDYDY